MNKINKISRTLMAHPLPIMTETRDEWLDVLALLRIVRRRIGLIAIVFTIVMTVTVPFVMNMKPVFSAQSRVIIKDAQTPDFMSSNLFGETKLNRATEAERLTSRDIAEGVISELGLARREEFNPSLRAETTAQYLRRLSRELFVKNDKAVPENRSDGIDRIIPEYLRHLSIIGASGSEVFSIGFNSGDPELAAAVPNALIRIYLQERENLFRKRIIVGRDWLEQQIVKQRLVVESALNSARAFRQKSVLGSPESLVVSQSIATLSEQRAKIVQKRSQLASKLATFEEAEDSNRQADTIDTPTMLGLRRDQLMRQNELDRLLGTYGSNSAEVLAVKEKLADTETVIGDEIKRYGASLTSQVAALESENASILNSLKLTQTPLSQIDDAQAELARLQQAASQAQVGLDELEQQRRKLESESGLPAAEVEVLSPASVPPGADGRGRAFYMLGAVFAGLAAAISVALLREMMDRTVRSQEHIGRVGGAVSVGMVPGLSGCGLRALARGPARKPDMVLLDAVRGLILEIRRSNGGAMPGSIAVTSALPREGKTTVAMSIACELARSGQQVVLVDCDDRRGRLHSRFRTTATPGFNEYLSGRSSLEEVTRTDDVSSVSLVARGDFEASRWLDRGLVEAMIKAANQKGQIVIFDGTSALAGSEMRALSGFVELVLMVVRWGKTTRSVAEIAVERLLRDDDDRIRVAINRVNLKRQALYGFKDGGTFAETLLRQY